MSIRKTQMLELLLVKLGPLEELVTMEIIKTYGELKILEDKLKASVP